MTTDQKIMKEKEKSRTEAIEQNVINISEDDNDDDVRKKKKKKRLQMSKTEATNDDVKKKKIKNSQIDKNSSKIKPALFQRFFSKEDEISILQGLIDFTFKNGRSPFDDMDGFYGYVKPVVTFNASKSQLVNKIWNLKKKYREKSVKKENAGEEEVLLCDDTDEKAFELSMKIWGSDGVLASKLRKNIGESSKKEVEKPELPISYGKDITSFVKADNGSSHGLDEKAMIAYWDSVEDDPKKKEMVEQFKKLKRMQKELCFEKIEVVYSTANMIFKENNGSSSRNVPFMSQNEKVVDVTSSDESENAEEENDVCAEKLESSEENIAEVSEMSMADRKYNDSKETQENEVDVVLNDANIETIDEDSFVASEGIKSNPSVAGKKLLVLDLNGLLAAIVSPQPGYKADFYVSKKAGEFQHLFVSPHHYLLIITK